LTKPDVCIYHHPCADGFTAAWAVWTRWPDIQYVAGSYGADMPDLAGKHVLMVDFSMKREALLELVAVAASVTILDHHVSAQRDLEPLIEDGTISGIFDMSKSGAMLAWEYCHPAESTPYLVQYVQDRDLWNWVLEDSKAVSAYIQLQSLTFAAWDKLADELEDCTGFDNAVALGKALLRKQDSEIGAGIKATKRRMTIGGYDVPVANLPHFLASEAGNILCRNEPFAATYFDSADGSRSFSLRSDKDDPRAIDVSLIATAFGGGGHKNASGFRAAKGWEGGA
jgi:oligoribonuclease NrnB/cAMP/cGMP phosphodiesterase (DHH superfamily)